MLVLPNAISCAHEPEYDGNADARNTHGDAAGQILATPQFHLPFAKSCKRLQNRDFNLSERCSRLSRAST